MFLQTASLRPQLNPTKSGLSGLTHVSALQRSHPTCITSLQLRFPAFVPGNYIWYLDCATIYLICGTAIDSADVVRDLGVWLDTELTMKHRISKMESPDYKPTRPRFLGGRLLGHTAITEALIWPVLVNSQGLLLEQLSHQQQQYSTVIMHTARLKVLNYGVSHTNAFAEWISGLNLAQLQQKLTQITHSIFITSRWQHINSFRCV